MLDAGGGGGGPQIGDQMSAMVSIGDSMANFAEAAANGAFEVSSTGGKALIDAIEDFQNWVDSQSDPVNRLTQQRMLGGGNGAKTMQPFVEQVVNDGQGFIPQLKALQKSLDSAKAGIEKAMLNYRQADENNAASVKGIQV